jgi:hypothetical protein
MRTSRTMDIQGYSTPWYVVLENCFLAWKRTLHRLHLLSLHEDDFLSTFMDTDQIKRQHYGFRIGGTLGKMNKEGSNTAMTSKSPGDPRVLPGMLRTLLYYGFGP